MNTKYVEARIRRSHLYPAWILRIRETDDSPSSITGKRMVELRKYLNVEVVPSFCQNCPIVRQFKIRK